MQGLADTVTLADRLRLARQRTGLSVRELGKAVGVSHSVVSIVERGEQRPTAEYLLDVAEPLGLDPLELLRDWGYLKRAEGAGRPDDPLRRLGDALAGGPWPQNVSAAVYALLSYPMDVARRVRAEADREATDRLEAALQLVRDTPALAITTDLPLSSTELMDLFAERLRWAFERAGRPTGDGEPSPPS